MIDKDTGELVFLAFRTPFNYDGDAVSRETGLECKDESLTVQSSLDETDINTIVARFGLTGELPSDYKPPLSGDFVDVTDYQSALNAVMAADAAFMEMPPSLRSKFENNPQKLMEFLADDKNRDSAIDLGLVPKSAAPVPPIAVRVVPEKAPGDSST